MTTPTRCARTGDTDRSYREPGNLELPIARFETDVTSAANDSENAYDAHSDFRRLRHSKYAVVWQKERGQWKLLHDIWNLSR